MPIREVNVNEITKVVRQMSMDANFYVSEDVVKKIEERLELEVSPVGKAILQQILENDKIAATEQVPACQDTGLAVIFIELGQEVHLTGGDLYEAINEGVRQGYKDGYLRKSTCHPFTRKNYGDNTPATVHLQIVPGDKIHITVAPKGGGSENMSRATMLKPADGWEGVRNFVVKRVEEAGPNPCPPIIVGVGVGGTIERSAYLAKKAILLPIDYRNPDPEVAAYEKELIGLIEKLGVGPQGLGGNTTALDVHMIMEPVHIASLPLAVNIQCHVARHKETTI